MNTEILGIHHITAICGHPQQNLDFYAGLLGLRLIKLTVNFDDPGTYHLYYGDSIGHPGTILTFFPWPDAPKGRTGSGYVTQTSFAIPVGAVEYWTGRLTQAGVTVTSPNRRFDEAVLSFKDPDGMSVELVAAGALDEGLLFDNGPVPSRFAIHGLHSATLSEEGYLRTAGLLTQTMGLQLVGEEENRFRYVIPSRGPASVIDILCAPEYSRGRMGVGTVHHIAWRTSNDESQLEWLNQLQQLSYNVSPVMDRKYFHSIYFREPGGILFEIATDPPGFGVDEPLDELGTHLVLPPWLEPTRSKIEAILPKLRLPAVQQESQ
jgi:catechol 2,3-dioxygenase-like lactoylglutathione lyase family enzyme